MHTCHPLLTEVCTQCSATMSTVWSCGLHEIRRADKMGTTKGLHHGKCTGGHGTKRVTPNEFDVLVRNRQNGKLGQ